MLRIGRPRTAPKIAANSIANGSATQNGTSSRPYSASDVKQADRVGADREERHEAEVEQAGETQGDVQAEAHQDVQRDERDDLGEEGSEQERQHHDDRDKSCDRRDAKLCPPLRRKRSDALGDTDSLADDPPDHDDGEDEDRADHGEAVAGEQQPCEIDQPGRHQRRAEDAREQPHDEDGEQAAGHGRAHAGGQLPECGGSGAEDQPFDGRDPRPGDAEAHREHRVQLGRRVEEHRAQVDDIADNDQQGECATGDQPRRPTGEDRLSNGPRPASRKRARDRHRAEQGHLAERDHARRSAGGSGTPGRSRRGTGRARLPRR